MATLTRFTIERITPQGTALYLAYFAGGIFEWSMNDEDAFEYEDREEAEADALAHGGEVSEHRRLPRRYERSGYLGHNERSRLEQHFAEPIVRGANLSIIRIAAE
ncbi:hypothetical protein [Rhizobium mongolense]